MIKTTTTEGDTVVFYIGEPGIDQLRGDYIDALCQRSRGDRYAWPRYEKARDALNAAIDRREGR